MPQFPDPQLLAGGPAQGSPWLALLRGLLSGATFGLDRRAGGDDWAARGQELQASNPGPHMLGEILGGSATGGAAGLAAGLGKATGRQLLMRLLAAGGAEGALSGVGQGESTSPLGMAADAASGAAWAPLAAIPLFGPLPKAHKIFHGATGQFTGDPVPQLDSLFGTRKAIFGTPDRDSAGRFVTTKSDAVRKLDDLGFREYKGKGKVPPRVFGGRVDMSDVLDLRHLRQNVSSGSKRDANLNQIRDAIRETKKPIVVLDDWSGLGQPEIVVLDPSKVKWETVEKLKQKLGLQ